MRLPVRLCYTAIDFLLTFSTDFAQSQPNSHLKISPLLFAELKLFDWPWIP
jgi:hypothetical protein